jgi:SAM-dependent MidA family methyltransferase
MKKEQPPVKNLPTPSPSEQKHVEHVLQELKTLIKARKGKLSFAEYMQAVLYAPDFGYYRGPTEKLGKHGDFITAPELSSLFSCALANQCAQILSHLNQGVILEFGGGTGTMAADILIHLASLQQLPKQYILLELSADLKKRQQHTLESRCPELLDRILWLDTLPTSPIEGVILANEVLDAMPVHLFRLENQQIFERYVVWHENHLDWQLGPPSSPCLEARLQHIQQRLPECVLKHGYESETNAFLTQWVASLNSSLSRGVVLLIDYGFPEHEYYHPDRYQGTLMCHYHHRAHPDPLILPGLQDITAHIDFTHLATAAAESGFDVTGFVPQAYFLLACGLLSLAEQLAQNEQELFIYNQQIKQLTLPGEMGELFKVIALAKNYSQDLLGFGLHDQRHRL